jgi:hypothetical protein
MAAAALVLSLLDDKPVLILAPATLIWHIEAPIANDPVIIGARTLSPPA